MTQLEKERSGCGLPMFARKRLLPCTAWSEKGRIYLSWFPFSGPGTADCVSKQHIPLIRVFQSTSFTRTREQDFTNPAATGSSKGRNVFTCLELGNFFSTGIKSDFKPTWWSSLYCTLNPSTSVKRQGGDENCVAMDQTQSLALSWLQPPVSALDLVSCLEKGHTKNVISAPQNWSTNMTHRQEACTEAFFPSAQNIFSSLSPQHFFFTMITLFPSLREVEDNINKKNA